MREALWDKARGIGIVLVVYGHVLRGLIASKIVEPGPPLLASDYAIYTFHMPLFFLLAGLNARHGFAKGNFLTSKFSTIIYPYVLWSVLQGGVQGLLNGSTNGAFAVQDLFAIGWKPVFHFWFLYAVFLCHVFAWVTRFDPVRITLFALLAYPLGLYFATSWGILSNALSFFLFYVAGLFLARHLKGMVSQASHPATVAATAVALGVAIFVACKLGDYHAPTALCAALLGILLVLQLAYLLPDSASGRAVQLLGLASMPIYLMHVFATAGMRILLMKLQVTNLAAHVVSGVAAGLLIPVAAYYCAYWIHKERWLGFGRADAIFRGGRAVPAGSDVPAV